MAELPGYAPRLRQLARYTHRLGFADDAVETWWQLADDVTIAMVDHKIIDMVPGQQFDTGPYPGAMLDYSPSYPSHARFTLTLSNGHVDVIDVHKANHDDLAYMFRAMNGDPQVRWFAFRLATQPSRFWRPYEPAMIDGRAVHEWPQSDRNVALRRSRQIIRDETVDQWMRTWFDEARSSSGEFFTISSGALTLADLRDSDGNDISMIRTDALRDLYIFAANARAALLRLRARATAGSLDYETTFGITDLDRTDFS